MTVTLRSIQKHVGVTQDGVWGPVTRSAVAQALKLPASASDRDIQRAIGVTVDGKVGPITLAAIADKLGMIVVTAPRPAPAVRKTSKAGIALIHSFEGLARVRPDGMIEAYPDPATGGEPWTIGWGSTGADPFNGGRIRRGTVWTRAQADERFRQHLAQFEAEVARLVTSPTTQGQWDALVSFAYNVGSANLARSTLLRLHNAGSYSAAAAEFARWNKAGGKVMAGLTRRRAAEATLYRGQA